MDRAKKEAEEIALADQLLLEWYEWSRAWRPHLGAPRCAPECREARTSRQYDDSSDLVRETADRLDMEAVEWCVDAVSFPYQNAIGIEMKNRQVKARVWRSVHGKTYTEALEQIIPHMRKKNLL